MYLPEILIAQHGECQMADRIANHHGAGHQDRSDCSCGDNRIRTVHQYRPFDQIRGCFSQCVVDFAVEDKAYCQPQDNGHCNADHHRDVDICKF